MTGFAPGNAFTLFSDQLANIPERYPEANTAVFGLGVSHRIQAGGLVNMGLYLERNGDVSTQVLQLGLSLAFCGACLATGRSPQTSVKGLPFSQARPDTR